MQSFFERIARQESPSSPADLPPGASEQASQPAGGRASTEGASARLAVYDSLTSIPRVIDLSAGDCEEFINLIATRTYQLSQERGGRVPFTIIKEVIENLIHACFSEAVITILDEGNTIRVADQGPGISDPRKALEPGFSTATAEMKRIIKGVGSGLPIVRECLTLSGGEIKIEGNLDRGTVVTLRMPPAPPQAETPEKESSPAPRLSTRQKKVLFLVTELGAAGPSRIARELRVALSTAYRDLSALEAADLVVSDESGKRRLTAHGVSCLDAILDG